MLPNQLGSLRGATRTSCTGLFNSLHSSPSSIRYLSTIGLRQPLSSPNSLRTLSASLRRNAAFPTVITPFRSFSLASLFTRKPQTPSLSPIVVAHIARLEADANAYPHDLARQVAYMQALLDTQASSSLDLLISRWEKVAQFDPSHPVLGSDKAFEIYLTALVQTDQKGSIPMAVQRRQEILGEQPVPEAASGPVKEGESPASQPTSEQKDAAIPPSLEPTATPSETPKLPPSQELASKVLAGKLAPLTPAPSPPLVTPTATSIYGSSVDVAQGTSRNPVQVTIVERTGSWLPKFLRWFLLLATSAFFLLIILAVFFENSGLVKQTSTQNQFEAPDGKKKVTFADVHGVDEAKEEVEDIIAFLKDPGQFSALGGRMPKGVLLTGPPGTGKTLLARAVAGEAGVPFFFASGSDFEEMFVGVGARRIRDLFAAARKKQPAIIFIDELDAVGGKRSTRDAQHARQTLNQLLTEMDGFQQSEGVIVIAATNFPQTLDKALVRPGRFDRTITVQLPDIRGRAQIIQHHMKDVVVGQDVSPKRLAQSTPGFSGAELQNMINLAAIQASKERAKEVAMRHMEWAKDRISMGAESKRVIDETTKLNTAYHEGGHTLVAMYTAGARPVHKVTCLPRGPTLGHTAFTVEDRRESQVTHKELRAEIDVAMGGRVAEQLLFGEDDVSTGASSDIRSASSTARGMVMQWGFSRLGPLDYSERENLSQSRQNEIEEEVTRLVKEGESRATKLLNERLDELHLLAKALVEHETLTAEEVRKVVKGEKLTPINELLDDELKKPDVSTPPSES